MKEAIVFASQRFLGFEICRALLEQGVEVLAIDDFNKVQDKWLEVGRNANIKYIPLDEWNEEISDQVRIFIPYYDEIDGGSIACLDNITRIVKGVDTHTEVHVIQLVATCTEQYVQNLPIDSKRCRNIKVTTIYIPTLIGPYQPNCFLASQLLQDTNLSFDVVEYVDDSNDLLYVRDAADYIVNCHKSGSILLQSVEEKSWLNAMKCLKEDVQIPTEESQKNIIATEKVKIAPSKSYKKILAEQRKHNF